MCFFKSNSQTAEEVEAQVGARFRNPEKHKARYRENGFQFPKCAVVCMSSPDVVELFHWGLIPSWTRNREDAIEIRSKTLNARSESIFEKPSFKNSIISKRCLVPSTGYFEWMHEGKKRIPHFISLKDQPAFTMGGIHDSWLDAQSGKVIHSFSIVTTEANLLTAKIHNSKQRMPLILEKADEEKWLDKKLSLPELEKLMRPHADQNMQAWVISDQRMKDSPDDDPEIIKEWIDPAGHQASLF